MISPKVHEFNQSTGVPLLTVDVDQSGELCKLWGVTAMPTFLYIVGEAGNVKDRLTGADQKKLKELFEKAKNQWFISMDSIQWR